MYLTRQNIIKTVATLIVLLPIYIYITNPMIVTVQGVGQAEGQPDSAVVAFTISSQMGSAKEANDDILAKSKVMEGILKTYGSGDPEIVRSQVSVTPATLGYVATMTMGGKITKYDQADSLVSALYANGATLVNQPIFSSASSSKYEADAYKDAIRNAHDKASKIGNGNLKFIKKKVAVIELSANTADTVEPGEINQETGENTSTNSFKMLKIVSVTYKMW